MSIRSTNPLIKDVLCARFKYIGTECELGNDVILQPGAVIGGDGFGFAPNSENNYAKVPQIGNVVIEDHVEIGSNTTVDRATLGSTIIRRGVKLEVGGGHPGVHISEP